MDNSLIINNLGFIPKENSSGIFEKKYTDSYIIEIDVEKKIINYGNKIQIGRTNCLILDEHHEENAVTLECVNRLLSIGYKPENIKLEQGYPAGHGTTKYLDILVYQDEKPYLMIECKTYDEEFNKELKNTQKNGGQLFTYFQQDTKTELLMLYASKLEDNSIISDYKIIKIEEEFRNAGSVKNVFKYWDKKFHEKGFWENPPYDFQCNKFTKGDLKELTEEKGKKLFHGFATILRKHSVSDKPNAFNVIFNLFLAKLYDEQKRDEDELEFQWKNDDNPVDFQVRLYNLHKEGLLAFLKKEIEGIEENFEAKKTIEEQRNAKKKFLKINKHFDIKNVMNDDDFEQNHRVLKEVVQLIEKYQIRYPRKQKYLSEFFELLLTTGLKQEVGQYFTPPPIAKFIVKSLPLHQMIDQEVNKADPKLPAVIDFAVGSGHFITEIMEEYQDIIKDIDAKKVKYSSAENEVISWQVNPYSWASKYVYGIEKDYRLVKVAKVGCYFYGDGLAQIIHGDGLDSLTNPPKSYIGLLEQNTNTEDSAKNKFSVVVANPPYSVKYCKEDLEYTGSQKDFTLYPYFTDNSKEIECLFVERTKHLLKDNGVAGVILPSSILSGTSEIYIKTREIILQNFEIIAITELGSNTFMAAGVNTVVLFLRRRNNSDSVKLKEFVEKFFIDFQDNNPPKPFNTIELQYPVTKYVNHVWNSVNLADYISLIKNTPNKNIQNHEFYKTYRKSVEIKTETEIAKAQKSRKTQLSEDDVQKIKYRIEWKSFSDFIETEKEKLLYFILAYNQNVVLVNTGRGDEEKHFLGYKFSDSKGNEGIHPIKGKSIDECTKLYNEKDFEDETKASSYIYKAYNKEYPEIHTSLKNNISYLQLVDMLVFDRESFIKNISTAVKKKVTIESKYKQIALSEISTLLNRGKTAKYGKSNIQIIKSGQARGEKEFDFSQKYFVDDSFVLDERKLEKGDILINSTGVGTAGRVTLFDLDGTFVVDSHITILRPNKEKILPDFILQCLIKIGFKNIEAMAMGSSGQVELYLSTIQNIKIPLPPKEIQEKIVSEIEVLEKKEAKAKAKVEDLKSEIHSIINNLSGSITIKELFDINADTLNPIEIWKNEYFTYVDIDSIGKGDGFINFNQKLLGKDAPSRAKRLAKNQTAIISTVRPYLKGFAFVDSVPEKTIFSTGFALLKSKSENKYITKLVYLLFMFSDNLMKQMKATMPKAAYPSINKEDIENYIIPLPPLSEQQKIVSEIEEIETQIADLEQQLSKIPQEKEAVLKKYL